MAREAAILKVTSLKINRLLPMATINMHMKFEIEIPKQTWLMLRKPCRLQTDGRSDRRTDKVKPIYPPPPPPTPTSLGRGIKITLKLISCYSIAILVQNITVTSLYGYHGVPDHRPIDCLFNIVFGKHQRKHRSSTLLDICESFSPVAGPLQKAST